MYIRRTHICDTQVIIQSFERESLEIMGKLKPEWTMVKLILAEAARDTCIHIYI